MILFLESHPQCFNNDKNAQMFKSGDVNIMKDYG